MCVYFIWRPDSTSVIFVFQIRAGREICSVDVSSRLLCPISRRGWVFRICRHPRPRLSFCKRKHAKHNSRKPGSVEQRRTRKHQSEINFYASKSEYSFFFIRTIKVTLGLSSKTGSDPSTLCHHIRQQQLRLLFPLQRKTSFLRLKEKAVTNDSDYSRSKEQILIDCKGKNESREFLRICFY